MDRWRRYVVSKLQIQSFRRKQQESKLPRACDDTQEEDMSLVQAHLSDIGSIRELTTHRRKTEAEAKTKAKTKASVQTKKAEGCNQVQQKRQEDTDPPNGC